MTRWRPLLATLAVLALTVASGNLECSPMLDTPEVAHGRELYVRMCAVCHGKEGEGYKADQAPALANQSFLASASDAYLAAAITHGRAGTTMSAWGLEHSGPLPPVEVDAVVALLRTWQTAPPAVLDERPLAGDAGRGATIFTRECAACHGPRGMGGKFVGIGNAQLLTTASNGYLRIALEHGRAGTEMSSFHDLLGGARDATGANGIDDVIALLRSWQAATPAGKTQRLAAPAKPPPLPLGPVPLNPRGPEPVGFDGPGRYTKADVIHRELARGARMGILDARAPSDYTASHIAGAVSVPFYDPEPYISQLPKDAWLVAYCGCPHAESGQLAEKLRGKGFTRVTVLDEGLRYWEGKKYETHKGTMP